MTESHGVKYAHELPAFFEPMLAEQYAPADVERIIEGCSADRPVTLRANTLMAKRDEVAAALDDAGIAYRSVAWYDEAFVIEGVREKALWELPVYKQGKVYLQSLSSMIPALVLGAQPGEDICDMCAAPGGKTTQIAALAGGGAYLTACEMHAPRAEKLEYNLRKLGTPNTTVMRVDSRQLDDFFKFDRILLDAPCSGSGTLRASNAQTAKRFTPALVAKSQKAQRALLAKALRLLKPGGVLVYSTCSVLARENEDIVEQCLKQSRGIGGFELAPIVGTSESGAEGENDGACFTREQAREFPLLPSRLPEALCLAPTSLFEGFFVAKIRRMR